MRYSDKFNKQSILAPACLHQNSKHCICSHNTTLGEPKTHRTGQSHKSGALFLYGLMQRQLLSPYSDFTAVMINLSTEAIKSPQRAKYSLICYRTATAEHRQTALNCNRNNKPCSYTFSFSQKPVFVPRGNDNNFIVNPLHNE